MREIRCAIELRADDSRLSPGRIVGDLLTYGQPASDRAEVFADGALTWDERGVVLNLQHDRQQPLLRFRPIVEGRAVKIDAAMPDTTAGRDTATLIRDRVLTGLSIEFVAQDEGERDGLREIRSGRLVAAAVVDDPAYAGRLEVRERTPGRRRVWL